MLDHTELEGRIETYFENGIQKGRMATPEQQINGLWMLKYKHQTLCIGYTQAASPQFEQADLTTMLWYHEHVMSKALELVGGERPLVQ